MVRILNALGQDLQSSGFAKVARAIDPMPQVWYDSADLAGLIYNNPLFEARLARYPAFLGLAERQEFQDMASDSAVHRIALLGREPIKTVLRSSQGPGDSPEPRPAESRSGPPWSPTSRTCRSSWRAGKSPKYDPEKILGRWNFNVSVTMSPVPQGQTEHHVQGNAELEELDGGGLRQDQLCGHDRSPGHSQERATSQAAHGGCRLSGRTADPQGRVEGEDGKYQLTLSGGSRDEQLTATVEGDRLTIAGEGLSLVFDRED